MKDKKSQKPGSAAVSPKNGLMLASVVCMLYPELAVILKRAVDDVLTAAMPRLTGMAAKLLTRQGKRLGDMAGDVVANWMVRLCESNLADRYDPAMGSPEAFFGRIMQLVSFETIRPLARQVTNADGAESIVDNKPAALEVKANAEIYELARQRSRLLPTKQRRAMEIMFGFHDGEREDEGNEDEPGSGACETPKPGGGPPSPRPSYASVSRGRKAIVEHVRARIS